MSPNSKRRKMQRLSTNKPALARSKVGSLVIRAENPAPHVEGQTRRCVRIPVDRISVGAGRRACDPDDVDALADSMQRIGLMTPIEVRATGDGSVDRNHRLWQLLAGGHRLEAAKQLGWVEIDCFVFEGNEVQARLREIAENLHVVCLTVLESDQLLAEWVRLTNEVGQNDHPSPGGAQPHDKGIAKAARTLPVRGRTNEARRKHVERALKVARMSPEAKLIVREGGLDNNRSALLAIVKEPTPDAQVRAAQMLASRKTTESRLQAPSPQAPLAATAVATTPDAANDVAPVDELSEASRRSDPAMASSGETAEFVSLYDTWKAAHELRAAWANAPTDARVRFVDEVLWGEAA
jgi:ParB family chromosome partitioning protein